MERTFILDKYEQEIEDSFESQITPTDMQTEMMMLQQTAKAHSKRKKPITIRVHELDLEAIKIKASKIGVAYQTYINMLIHKSATSFK